MLSCVGKWEGLLMRVCGSDQLHSTIVSTAVIRQLLNAMLPPLCVDAEPALDMTRPKNTRQNTWRFNILKMILNGELRRHGFEDEDSVRF
jgi:hypothetical protein